MRTKINKSAAIREAIAVAPGATVSQIVETLANKGIKVTPQLVSNVKSRMAAGAKPKGRRGRPMKVSGSLTVAQLEAAAGFAKSIGGIEQASAALAMLERLR